MPEGPEVRRAANRIARALGNAPLEDVEFTQNHLRDASAGLRPPPCSRYPREGLHAAVRG